MEVLSRTEFYDLVEEIHLIYVRFDLIVYHAHLMKLKKFTKLKKLVLSQNYLSSFILLSKIECLNTLEHFNLYDNEILKCVTLKSFIVYRFQHIKYVSFKLLSCDFSSTERNSIQRTGAAPNNNSNSLTKYCLFRTFSRVKRPPSCKQARTLSADMNSARNLARMANSHTLTLVKPCRV